MVDNITIKGIEIYHPNDIETNDKYLEEFKLQGKDVRHLMVDIYGRDRRYVIHNDSKESKEQENSLTMQIKATKKLLAACNVNGSDIDGIILASQVPEYLVPPNSILIHEEINGKLDCFCYDMNSNCISMIMALEQAYLYMEHNKKLNRVIVVGGDFLTQTPGHNQEILYGCFGDASCALLLERDNGTGKFIDNDFFVNDTYVHNILFPACGISNIQKGKNIPSTAQAIGADLPIVVERIHRLLEQNHLTLDDISYVCCSQYVRANIEQIANDLNEPLEKFPYVGDEFGYTGVTSPFLAFHKLVKEHSIKHGDYILFWSIGSGVQHIFTLIQY